MNHEYRTEFINESRIIEVKQDRNHEYPKSNDSASTPESVPVSAVSVRWRACSTMRFLSSFFRESFKT